MKHMKLLLLIIVFASTFTSCKREHAQSDNILPGVWVKGTNAGDTLQFIRINNKNILRYNISFNAALPAFRDLEYEYKDGKLAVQLYTPSTQDFYTINSFTWNDLGKEFKVQAIELFPILSSTLTTFTYRKI